MEIKILGRQALEEYVQSHPKQYDVIYHTHSASPKIDLIESNALESLHMPIDDIDHYELKLHVAPSAESVQRFLDFAKGRKKMLVACAAGVSRSSSTAYIVAAREFGAARGLAYLDKNVHWPNRLNVFIGSALLKDPQIWAKYVEWSWQCCHGFDPSVDGRWPSKELISKMGFDKLENGSKV